MATPSNWPPEVIYLTRNAYSSKLTHDDLAAIRPKAATQTPPQPPSKRVKIRRVDDVKHPAHGQFGLFAAQKIPPHTHLMDYLGYVHNEQDTDQNSNYDIVLHKPRQIAIDANKMGCEARMVNDYRGIQPRPNVKFDDYTNKQGELRMAIFSTEAIAKGQELCINYGKGFWQGRGAP